MNFSFSRIHLGLGGLLAAVALLVLSPGASAATINVPGDEPTIQDAVDSANPGDTIVVKGRGRSYFENVVVTTNRLTIVGRNRNGREAVVDGTSPGGGTHGLTFDVDADNFTLENMRSLHGNGIDCTGQNCEFIDVIVNMSDQGGDCIEIDGAGGAVKRSRLAGCDSNAVNVDGNRFALVRNTMIHGDSTCVSAFGDDGRVLDNAIRICEDGEVIDLDGDSNEIRGNFGKSGDNGVFEIDGDRNVIAGNRGANTDTTSGCFDITGIRVRVRGNASHTCGKGYDVEGENMKVIGNSARNSPQDDGFEINCFDLADGADAADTCREAVIRGNKSQNSGDDDEAFRIDDSGSEGGMTIIGNVSRNSYEEGFDVDADNALIEDNVSRRDGSEGNESGFDICGTGNRIVGNRAVSSGEDGIQVSCGNRNKIRGNLAKFANLDGIHLESGTDGVIRGNKAFLNNGDGIENDGTDTRIVGNEAFDNRRDCANDGTVAVNRRNRCADGSDFEKAGTVNRVRPRRG